MGPHRKGDSSAPSQGQLDALPQCGYHHPHPHPQSATAVDYLRNATDTARSPHPPCCTMALVHGRAAALPREGQAPTVCAAQGNIVSADPSRTDDVVDLPPTYKGWLSFEEKHRLFFVRQRIQFEAFETMGWCIDERLEDLVDRPITDVSMGELHRLDEEDLRSFCRIKCIPVTVDKLELRRHVIGASRAYLHISSRLPFTSTSMKLLIHKYSAAIEQCYIDVAN